MPSLPHAAAALIRMIDGGDPNPADMERVIASDPALATMILRVAATRVMNNAPTSIRIAIMRIGLKEVRALAISLAVRRVLNEDKDTGFDSNRYARHSLYVAFLARYLSARRQKNEPYDSNWSPDELFSAGIMHDIAVPLLARVAPEDFRRVEKIAQRTNTTLSAAFTRLYECNIHELGAIVARMWKLPEVFCDTMQYMDEPWKMPDEEVSLSALNYADWLAGEFGAGLETWTVDQKPVLEAEIEVGIPPEERSLLQDAIERHVTALLDPAAAEAPAKVA